MYEVGNEILNSTKKIKKKIVDQRNIRFYRTKKTLENWRLHKVQQVRICEKFGKLGKVQR